MTRKTLHPYNKEMESDHGRRINKNILTLSQTKILAGPLKMKHVLGNERGYWDWRLLVKGMFISNVCFK